MAKPVDFSGANLKLKAPPGHEDTVGSMMCHKAPSEYISRWRLTPMELAEVNRTGDIWFALAARDGPPPVFISGLPLMAWYDEAGETIQGPFDPDTEEARNLVPIAMFERW